MYNLTENQKALLRWIVQQVREGNLDEEFVIGDTLTTKGVVFFEGKSTSSSPAPHISKRTLDALAASGLVFLESVSGSNVVWSCGLLAKGYEAVDTNFEQPRSVQKLPIVNSIFGTPNRRYAFYLFVLMPFAPDLKPIYDNHIKKVADTLDLYIARADDFFSQNSIMHEIWSAIYNATILIADCTGKNPNVFYEIGIAHTLDKPVILITQNPDDVPFDLRHRRYIQYAYTPLGMEKFERDLAATILETMNELEDIAKNR